MRLESVTSAIFEQAVASYLKHAWGDLADSHWPALDLAGTDAEHVLEGFSDERREGRMRRFTLRLGNRRYPFMKLVFQESLIRNSFFFGVDTHDELDIKETTPDYAEWLLIRDYNARVKEKVEREWKDLDVPTFEDVLEDVDRAPVPDEQRRDPEQAPTIFVVDDDREIAEGVRRILSRRGYRVEVSHSAEEALRKLEQVKPDLVLSDLEMGGGMTGLDFARRLRENPRRADVPFLLATAAGIDLSCYTHLDGFLVKPYEIEVLLAFLSKHLQAA